MYVVPESWPKCTTFFPSIVYLVKGGTGEVKDGEFLDGVIGVLAQLDVGVPVCKEGEVRRPVR